MTANADERRRQNIAIARWRADWQARHGLDDVELIEPGAATEGRWPTAEQEKEFIQGVRRILGQDPETGRYLD